MWAHYADQHKGCCLEFDFSHYKSDYNCEECFPFAFVEQIDYLDNLPTLDDTKAVRPHKKGSIYMTKFKHWEYEKEWRAVMYKGAYKPFGKEVFKSKCSFKDNMTG